MTLVDYLEGGALMDILRTNAGGTPPRIWITPNGDGSFRWGDRPEENSIGGQSAPFGAIETNKIFLPERDRVISFIRSFGLSQPEAEEVVERIGTQPRF